MERVRERREHMEVEVRRAGLHRVTWVPAIDAWAAGYVPRRGLACERDDVLIEHNWDGRKYLTGEDAIFQSHLKALEALIAGGAPHGLIFEDDAELAPDFGIALELLLRHARAWDIVSLEGFRPWGGRPAIEIARLDRFRLVASLNPCAGSAAYVVSRRAAETLLARATETIEPFDNYLNALWRHGLRVLDVSPFPARQGTLVSLRHRTRPAHRRTPVAAFGDWRRHIYADFIRRYLDRWARQATSYGIRRLTIARWTRNWEA
jgi:GR25 family glycosyltransferase involved in LPS biosynthesis